MDSIDTRKTSTDDSTEIAVPPTTFRTERIMERRLMNKQMADKIFGSLNLKECRNLRRIFEAKPQLPASHEEVSIRGDCLLCGS